MKRLALAAAGAAVVGLTACSHGGAPTAAAARHETVTPAVPVNCSQRYDTWKHGHGKDLITALKAVSSAETTGNTHVLKAALKKARPAVAGGTRHPMPACADPRGYWDVLLMHVNAAAAGKASPSSVRAAMKDVPKIERQLTAELKSTAR